MKQLIDFESMSPMRRPDWRYERVLQMVRRPDHPGRSTKRDDEYVRALRQFILRYHHVVDDPAQLNRLAYENPGLYWAYLIHVRDEDQQHLRTTLEGRLLARLTDAEIAADMKSIPEVAFWYEKLFFNIRDRLDALDWICNFVLIPAYLASRPAPVAPGQPAGSAEVANPYFGATFKFLAYFGGKHALDYAMGGFRPRNPVLNAESVGNWFIGGYFDSAKQRSNQAMRTFEVNRYNVMELFQVTNQIITIERSSESEEGKRDAMLRVISAMMGQMPWAVGRDGGKNFKGTVLEQLDEQAAELRDDEVLLLAGGRKVSTIEGIEQLKLPAPPVRNTGQEDRNGNADAKQGS